MVKAALVMSIVAVSLSAMVLVLSVVDFVLKMNRQPYMDGTL